MSWDREQVTAKASGPHLLYCDQSLGTDRAVQGAACVFNIWELDTKTNKKNREGSFTLFLHIF